MFVDGHVFVSFSNCQTQVLGLRQVYWFFKCSIYTVGNKVLVLKETERFRVF